MANKYEELLKSLLLTPAYRAYQNYLEREIRSGYSGFIFLTGIAR